MMSLFGTWFQISKKTIIRTRRNVNQTVNYGTTRHPRAGWNLQAVCFRYCTTDQAMWHLVCGPAAASGLQKLSSPTNEDGERSEMIANLNKDLDMTLTLCHSVCVCVCLEVMSSHLPAVMLWLASSLRAHCQQEVSSTQRSHQRTAGCILNTDRDKHTFKYTQVLKCAQIHPQLHI